MLTFPSSVHLLYSPLVSNTNKYDILIVSRFKEFLKKTPGSRPPPLPALRHAPLHPDEVEYYNDLPGKTPPSSNLIDFNTEIPYAPEYTNGEIQVNKIENTKFFFPNIGEQGK